MTKNLNGKMAKEEKSCMKVPSKKMTRLEHARQNIFNSLTNTVNQNYPEFVMMNKKAIFKKFDKKNFEKIKVFGKQGFNFFEFS